MKGRHRLGQHPQERVMEIVGLLLRKILQSPEGAAQQNRVIENLERKGYGRNEIDAAIELVLAVPEIIASIEPRIVRAEMPANRVFSQAEQRKLSVAIRGRLLQYRAAGLLTEFELEEVLMQLMLGEEQEVGLAELHLALRKVVEDYERLMIILPGIEPGRTITTALN